MYLGQVHNFADSRNRLSRRDRPVCEATGVVHRPFVAGEAPTASPTSPIETDVCKPEKNSCARHEKLRQVNAPSSVPFICVFISVSRCDLSPFSQSSTNCPFSGVLCTSCFLFLYFNGGHASPRRTRTFGFIVIAIVSVYTERSIWIFAKQIVQFVDISDKLNK